MAAVTDRSLSEIFVINGSEPGQVSESDSGPIHCKHSLMDASNPGACVNR